MSIMEQAYSYLEQVKALVGDAHRAARRALYEALPQQAKDEARRIQKASHFVAENANVEDRKEHLSPSGAYKLVVTPYSTSPGCWSYTQGLVYRRGEDKPLAEIQRNYGQFPFAWVEGHEKGDFLLAGEDYQGQTVINLRTGARRDHLPKSAAQGAGFCWASIHPNPKGDLVAAQGCHWGGAYEIRFYDFSEPMLPPWPKISGTEGQLSEFFGWVGDESASIGGYESFHEGLNMSEDAMYLAHARGELSDELYNKYGYEEDSWKDRKIGERIWTRPPPLQSLTDHIREHLPWFREQGRKVPFEVVFQTQALLSRLSKEEWDEYKQSDAMPLFAWALENQDAS